MPSTRCVTAKSIGCLRVERIAFRGLPTPVLPGWARSRQSGTLTLALRSIADVNAVEKPDDQQSNKRGENLNVIRYGVASQQTVQK